MTQALIVLRDGSRISYPKDYRDPVDEFKETVRFY
jgi:hypothetical protein